MARENRLKYIQIDSDFFDKEKVFLIDQEFGFEGGYIAIRLLLWIADREGWGVPWGATGPAYFAVKGLGDKDKTETVRKIAERLTAPEIDFFDREAFEAGYLTSRRIYEDWRKTMKKNSKEIDERDIPDIPTFKTPAETGGNRRKPAETKKTPAETGAREDKIRLDKIYTSPPAREENTQDGENGEPAQNGQTYTPEEHKEAERRIELWNQITKGTGAEYTEFYPQESLISRMIDRIRQEPREEIWRRVFENARDEPFRWTLPAVFNKPGNFDQLKITIQKPTGGASKSPPERFGMDRPGFGKEGYYQ